MLNQVSPLTRQDFDLIGSHLRQRTFKKGEILVKPGETQQNCYLVVKGVIMAYLDQGDRIHVQAFAYAPDMAAIPESFLKQTPSRHFLECMSDVTVLELPYASLQLALKLSHSLETVFRKLTENMLIGILNRHTELQILSMEERFRSFTKRSPHLLQLVPHKYIASYLGIDPTNFSKLFNSIKI